MENDKVDFENWGNRKFKVHDNKPVLANKGEIWWCNLGKNIGFEEDGKGEEFERPVLVLKVFNSEICICVPLTSKEHNDKFHCKVQIDSGITSYAILSQIRNLSTRRFRRFVGSVPKNDRLAVIKRFYNLIE